MTMEDGSGVGRDRWRRRAALWRYREHRVTKEPSVPATLPTLLDITGVAEHLGVSVRHVRRLVAERRIPFVKWGHLLRFDPEEIAAWIDEARWQARR